MPRTPRATVVAVLSLLAAGCGDDHSNSGGALTGPDSAIPTHSLRVVYTAGGDEVFHLWTMTAGGDDPVQLTFSDGAEATPAWFPDGTRIAYSQNTLDDEGASIRILVVDDPGAEGLRVADGGDWPSWSPDGRTILYTGDNAGTEQLFTVSAAG